MYEIEENLEQAAEEAADLLHDRLPVMVITGAGISVESGIPPFRGPGGLWEKYDPYEYGDIETFRIHPERSWEMMRELIEGSLRAEPNEAHRTLVRMERKGWIGPIVTQNVDGLHGIAGTRDLLEVHGNARRIYCTGCGKEEIIEISTWSDFKIRCSCGAIKRPDIVFFGEALPEIPTQRAFDLAYKGVDIILVGTSIVVQPVSLIPVISRSRGGRIVEINPRVIDERGITPDVLIKAPAIAGLDALERALGMFSS